MSAAMSEMIKRLQQIKPEKDCLSCRPDEVCERCMTLARVSGTISAIIRKALSAAPSDANKDLEESERNNRLLCDSILVYGLQLNAAHATIAKMLGQFQTISDIAHGKVATPRDWHWTLRSMETYCGPLCAECGEAVPSYGRLCEDCYVNEIEN